MPLPAAAAKVLVGVCTILAARKPTPSMADVSSNSAANALVALLPSSFGWSAQLIVDLRDACGLGGLGGRKGSC